MAVCKVNSMKMPLSIAVIQTDVILDAGRVS